MPSQPSLFPYFERANQETIDLLLEARDYAQAIHRSGHVAPPPPRQLRINCEAMRMISRLARVMAWIMERKAPPPPSNTPRENGKEELPLGENALCMDAAGSDDMSLPLELRALLRRSHRLYVRVARLDAMSREGRGEVDPAEIGEFTARLVGR